MAFLSVATIAGALFVLGLFLTIALNLHGVLAGVQEKIAVELFLTDKVTKAQVSSVVEEISAIEGVDRVEFITKADAMHRFSEKFGSRYLVGLSNNPFPPSILVHLESGTKLAGTAKSIADKYTGHRYVTQIAVPGDVAKKLSDALGIFMTLSIIWALILIFAAILIIVNTIKLTIYSRRDSINIMQLVGATPSFIQRPFTIEGLFQGLLAGALSSLALYCALMGMKKLVPTLSMPPIILLYGFILVGVIFGALGSRLAVKRFL